MSWELLASGFGLVEGPTIDVDGSLVFSDVLDGGVFRLAAGGAVSTVVPKRRGVGGLVLHGHGGFVIGGRDVQHVDGDGTSTTVLRIDGLPGFNDLCADGAGRVYAGSVRFDVLGGSTDAVPGELWRVDLDGSASVVYDGVEHCNGVALSADGSTVYHSDTRAGHVVVHDLHDGGAVASNRRHWPLGERARPDGLALDEHGALWVVDHGGGRVVRFRPDGAIDGVVETPVRRVTSVCFRGRELIVVSGSDGRDERRATIWSTTVDVAGAPVPVARV